MPQTLLKEPTFDDAAKTFKEGEDGLLPGLCATCWSGHSERATLVSLLAALGVPREERNHVGRWSPSGSEEYVRTYRAMMRKLVNVFVVSTSRGDGYTGLEEGEALEVIADKMVKKGVEVAEAGWW